MKTSRERHKSAPYRRLFKCQVFFYSTQKAKSWSELARRGTLSHFLTTIVAKQQKIEGGKIIFEKKTSHNAEKTERGTL